MQIFYKKPYLLALLIAIIFTLWLLSGNLQTDEKSEELSQEQSQTSDTPVISVQTRNIVAKKIDKTLRLNGQTAPERSVEIKAQVAGVVERVFIEPGAFVKKGQKIAQLAVEDRADAVKQAQTLLRQRQLEFEGAKKLRSQGLSAETKIAESEALLTQAEAQLTRAKLALDNTKILAPFAGILERRHIEQGDYVSSGQTTATLIDSDPLVIKAYVAEADVARLNLGQEANISLWNFADQKGRLRYLSKNADSKTHTFEVEVAVSNPAYEIPAGLSAAVQLTLGQTNAHKISPGLFALNDAGEPGVKVLDNTNHVKFKPITIIKAEVDGYWVSGLDEEEALVVRGQGFVRDGQVVTRASETSTND